MARPDDLTVEPAHLNSENGGRHFVTCLYWGHGEHENDVIRIISALWHGPLELAVVRRNLQEIGSLGDQLQYAWSLGLHPSSAFALPSGLASLSSYARSYAARACRSASSSGASLSSSDR